MLNQVYLVGRIKRITYNAIFLNIAKSKTERPETVKILVSDNILDNVDKYCHEDDLIGVKGRLQTDGLDPLAVTVWAEKITYLTSKGGDK